MDAATRREFASGPVEKNSVGCVGWKDTDVGKIPEALGVVHAVADDEMVRNGEAHVLRLDGFETAVRLVEQRGYAKRAWLVLHEHALEEGEGEASVEDVLHQDDVAPLDRMVEVLDELDRSAGARASAVAGDSDE